MMRKSDVPKLLLIERASFRAPWDEQRFLDVIDAKSGCKSVVYEEDGNIVGYFVVEVHARSMHLLNLAIHPEHRRKGHACRCLALIDQLAGKAFQIAKSRDAAALRPIARPATGKGGRIAADTESARLFAVAAATKRASDGSSADEGEIFLEVEESNLPAQLLYRKMGYRAVEIMRNHYAPFHEDGYKMVRKVRIAAEETARS